MEKVAIVTGASRGIGREIAKELAKQGIKVVANYNKSEEKAKELKEKFNIDIFKADVSKHEEVKKIVDYTLEKYKTIDILINNAGIAQSKLIIDVTDDDWKRLVNTNLYSAFAMTREVCKTGVLSIYHLYGELLELQWKRYIL